MYASKGLMQSHLASYRGVLTKATAIEIYKDLPPTDSQYLANGIPAATYASKLLATVNLPANNIRMVSVEPELKWRFIFQTGNIQGTWSANGEASWALFKFNNNTIDNAIMSVGNDEFSVLRLSTLNAVQGQNFLVNSFNLVITRKI